MDMTISARARSSGSVSQLILMAVLLSIMASPALATESTAGVAQPEAQGSWTDVVSFTKLAKKLSKQRLEDILEKPLPTELLKRLEPSQLRVLRNTTFALGGARFKSHDLRTWFKEQDWYVGNKPASQVKLSAIALQNVKVCKLEEQWFNKYGGGLPELFHFYGYHDGVIVFYLAADGEHAGDLFFVSIEDGKVLLDISARWVSMSAEGRVQFWQAHRPWKPSTKDPGPPGWKAPDCVQRDIPPEYRLECWPIYKTFIQLGPEGDFGAAVRHGFAKSPVSMETPEWECVCSS